MKTFRKGHEKAYSTWSAMKSRCYNKNHIHYNAYGGRGIKVCERWLGKDGFEHFYKDMFPKPDGATLDRIDNDADYCPENCRWSNKVEQANNTRRNKIIEYNGESMTAAQWARKIGIPYRTLLTRLRRGMPLRKALSSGRYR